MKNDKQFLVLPAKFPVLLLICAAIGLIRNVLHLELGPFFFHSFDPDIIYVMLIWPISLFLFPAMLLTIALRLLGYKNISVESIFALFFSLQILHLFIPVFDWVGHLLHVPNVYNLSGSSPYIGIWYTNLLFMTPGILLGWFVTIYMVVKVLRKYFKVSWPSIITSTLPIFVIIVIPTYLIFPALNTIFNSIFGIWPILVNADRPAIPALFFWGYGTYFLLTALIGGWYFLKMRKTDAS